MSDDDSTQRKPDPFAQPTPESLNEALDALAELLERTSTESGAADAAGSGIDTEDEEGSFSIPLLEDVVQPEQEGAEAEPAVPREEVYRQLVDRLTNEIEIIVQTGLDEALGEARRRILAQVKEHVEIILPEILEELARARTDKGS
ncbi:MAG: hypothetical protein GWN84_01585 [Gammaproteobacteria bacterium]|nr:hypothetical protein [Gammaproteobacteria bacterium]NIR81853.1 hypothetical protein [Gammaproteobacteria bacterium]NIR88685.1 hypothetical protein [Gammaproteobacteria bacterium]NIU02961.1 hypothetical protein [Gammaproteobacteria bacterium]NIV50482.1 hypothetical protein [Gammaproteobacteria bacterium]